MSANNILQYESKIWNTANLLRGCGIKESEWPSFMMPFFALAMIESRLLRMYNELEKEIGKDELEALKAESPDEFQTLIGDKGQGFNIYLLQHNKTLRALCQNNKTFDVDFDAYLHGFDSETKNLLGVDASEGEKFLDIKGIINKLNAKKILFAYTKEWSGIDLQAFNNSEITTLEEHIKRKWADISAETAGEQYTPDDVIALIAEIIASKITDNEKILKIYDCTCGGGNMLFGVEDRINQKFQRLTETFGQDWNDALYALAKIESRFRIGSHIEHGNTLVNDKFSGEEFDVVVANPPYGVSWKGYQSDIEKDKTGRFKFLPSISDGQLLFMQHLISKMSLTGMGVVVHNGSTLFSGDAGSAESNIRKWMLDNDLVEAIIQLPTDEFFNTGIYTYLWVLNKQKPEHCKNKLMLINASEKFKALKKSKGSKRKEVDELSRAEIVQTLTNFSDNNYAKVFDKHYFYYNKQAIMLTNIDENGLSIKQHLANDEKSLPLSPVELSNGEHCLTKFVISQATDTPFGTVAKLFDSHLKPMVDSFDYKEQALMVKTDDDACYYFDNEQETIIKDIDGTKTALGCGKIVVKAALKKPTKKQDERIEISVELTPDYQKDYEIIPYSADEIANNQAIADFMAKYVTKPFEYLENTIGVELNFNKVFYKPETLRPIADILADIRQIDDELANLDALLGL